VTKAPTRAVAALVRAGIPYQIRTYDHDPAVTAYAKEAAVALGVEPGRVFKTLVATTGDGQLVVAVVPATTELDLKALAGVLGVKRAAMAGAATAERSTGYIVGAISPLGQKRPHPTVVDDTAPSWPTILVSGGRRGLELELDPDDLINVTGGQYAPIARPR
jgi:Cys-tRNA(Pro)/Cys-tRNA(Cys) deacylase